MELAAATVGLILVVMVPAVIAVHLFVPRLHGLLETVAILPFVIPAIALVAGLTALIRGPDWLIGSPFYLALPYFFLALPYAYRAIDLALATLDLTHLRLAAQSLGVVFQNYALFPHLPAWENVAFPLRVRGLARAKRRARAIDMLMTAAGRHHIPWHGLRGSRRLIVAEMGERPEPGSKFSGSR